jgi:hypothetical protein
VVKCGRYQISKNIQYNGNLETSPLAEAYIPADDSTALDPEGITQDPNTGTCM